MKYDLTALKPSLFYLILLLLAGGLFGLIPNTSLHPPVQAQASGNCSTSINRSNGLVATPNITGSFGTSAGVCVIDPAASFVPYKIPTYDELKSLYFDQVAPNPPTVDKNTINGNSDGNAMNFTGNKYHLFYITGNLSLTQSINGDDSGIIFVGGNLNLGPVPSGQFVQGNGTHGIIFVVQGDINIDVDVIRIDASLIGNGNIYTAGANCAVTSVLTNNPLIINGSLIEINSVKAIKFCRNLRDNTKGAAEQVNYQPKYLYIMKDMLSEKIQRWSEVAGDVPIPTPGPQFCGNGVCDSDSTVCGGPENPICCNRDCPDKIADGYCSGAETHLTDPADCPPPACNTNLDCGTSTCQGPANTCSTNNGSKICYYTRYNGPLSSQNDCTPARANQPCTVNNCTGGKQCIGGTCQIPIPKCWAYADNDRDGYGAGGQVQVNCPNNVLPAGYVSNNYDCNNNNANVHPGQSQYFLSADSRGSYDYNCDGGIQKQFDSFYSDRARNHQCSLSQCGSGCQTYGASCGDEGYRGCHGGSGSNCGGRNCNGEGSRVFVDNWRQNGCH